LLEISKQGTAVDDVVEQGAADNASSYNNYWVAVVLPLHAEVGQEFTIFLSIIIT
jgi:hypothetical protein